MTKIVLIAGSPTASSRSAALLAIVADMLTTAHMHTSNIHVRELPASALLQAHTTHPDIQACLAQLASAQGVVVATPVYKAAYTGVLKAFFDLLPPQAFNHKVILPLMLGGASTHALALDYALRPALVALGAEQILRGLFLTDAMSSWSAEGQLVLDATVAVALQGELQILVQQLTLRDTTETR